MALIKPSGLSLMGGTLRGALRFSGTLHPGLIVLSLTTAQRDALTPELGTVIFNVTTGDFEGYDGVWGALGGGGGGAWGTITGTLSDQTDLNTALTARVLKAGDTMTGTLTVDPGATPGIINLAGTGVKEYLIAGLRAMSASTGAVMGLGEGFATLAVFSSMQLQKLNATETSTPHIILNTTTASAGTPGNGFGTSILFNIETSTVASRIAGRIETIWSVATDATRQGDIIFKVGDFASGGNREALRMRGNGTAAAIGFLGATPVVRAAHIADAAGDDAATVNAILVVLENLGFIATS